MPRRSATPCCAAILRPGAGHVHAMHMHMHMPCTCTCHAHAMHMPCACHAHACGPVPSSASTDGTSRERARVATAEAAAVRRSVTSCASLTWARDGLACSAPVTRSRNSPHPVPTHPSPAKPHRCAPPHRCVYLPPVCVLAVYPPPLPMRVAHREQPSVCRREEQHCPLVRREGAARVGREDCLRLAAGVLAWVWSAAVSATSAGPHEPHCSLPLGLSGSAARPECAAQPGAWRARPQEARVASCGTSGRPFSAGERAQARGHTGEQAELLYW